VNEFQASHGAGVQRDGAHILPIRVYYEDTDDAGLVYYANYLKFAERARTELLRTLGFDHRSLKDNSGVAFAVRRCAADYRRPARLDDRLEVHTRVMALRGASVEMEQIVKRDGADMVAMEITLACMRYDGRPARLPADVRASFRSLMDSRQWTA